MISSNPSPRLIKHIIRSYARLAENSRVRSILKENLPPILKDKNFYNALDESSKRWLQNMLKSIASTSSNDRSTMSIINGLSGMSSLNNLGNGNSNLNSNLNIPQMQIQNGFNHNNFDIQSGGNYFPNSYNEYFDSNTMGSMVNSKNGSFNMSNSKNFGSMNGVNSLNMSNSLAMNNMNNGNIFSYKNAK
jgi:hypothetical protein